MLQANLIGNLGADAEVKVSNGTEFITFRVAHTHTHKLQDGTTTSNTVWVDCILSKRTGVVDYLKKGTQVYVDGNISLRVYSSPKDRCMKAGITIHVQNIELIGSKPDSVPSIVFDPEDGSLHSVCKEYFVPDLNGVVDPDKTKTMVDEKGRQYVIDTLGFIKPLP